MTRPPTPDRDPGLQPERTRLAWRRTTLSSTVAAVLAMRAALHNGAHPSAIIICALCCTLWLTFLTVAHHRIRTLTAPGIPPTLPPGQALAAALCTVAVALCAAALVY
ncbi:DUF202 domain-containing protein [Streptomyces graminifolii]|uniref:DUF202 domain-containing protein n=1 Tax=Streptomyces TaxID=1883 RepID=UPI0036AACC83